MCVIVLSPSWSLTLRDTKPQSHHIMFSTLNWITQTSLLGSCLLQDWLFINASQIQCWMREARYKGLSGTTSLLKLFYLVRSQDMLMPPEGKEEQQLGHSLEIAHFLLLLYIGYSSTDVLHHAHLYYAHEWCTSLHVQSTSGTSFKKSTVGLV